MAQNRLWVVGSVAAMIVIALLAWFIGIQPQLSSIASINAERQTVDAQNAAQQAVLDQLERDKKDEKQLRAEYDLASRSVPAGTGVPRYIDQLNALAAQTGVTLTRITVSDAAAFEVAAPAESAPIEDENTADASGDASSDGSAETAADVSGSAQPVGLGPLTPANFAYLGIGIEIEGEYANVLAFVHGLQTGERLMLVNAVEASSVQAETQVNEDGVEIPVEAGPQKYSASISGLIYSLVDAGAVGSTATDTGAQEAAGEN
ncbi:hypothetical protein ET445_07015 [Agromyces protaetiae]|uniref:Pilus assembly protein PilO n=1 Tax=Agromyces protaetiae TaxID=2509455 RepID=A0A4P6FDQ8_9MICO|nr:hypothetical protein [Agromyces protaetiae]QAY73133.1 hypothetical protein ET445_07015 [Agromyces protaetiae]